MFEIREEDKWYVFATAIYDDYALVYNCMSGEYKRVYFSTDEENTIVLGEVLDVKITDVTEEENDKLDGMKNRFELLESDVAAKIEEVQVLQEQVQTITEEKTVLETENVLKAEELEIAKTENESLQNELETTKEVVNQYSRKNKLEIINKFSTKVENEELINELSEKIDELSEEDIKAKLGQALAEQVLAIDEPEQEQSNFTLKVNLEGENLGNSCWDIVRRHKNNK